ncbi:unnamed protein product, partial [Symbiodinium pilosum]
EMAENEITSSALNGHLECGLATAQKELQSLRQHTSDQLKSLDERLSKSTELLQNCGLAEKLAELEAEVAEQAITNSAVNGHLEGALHTAQKELQCLRELMADQTGSLEKLFSQSVSRLEADLSEQAITNSALNGHLECGLATSKQELESMRVYT